MGGQQDLFLFSWYGWRGKKGFVYKLKFKPKMYTAAPYFADVVRLNYLFSNFLESVPWPSHFSHKLLWFHLLACFSNVLRHAVNLCVCPWSNISLWFNCLHGVYRWRIQHVTTSRVMWSHRKLKRIRWTDKLAICNSMNNIKGQAYWALWPCGINYQSQLP